MQSDTNFSKQTDTNRPSNAITRHGGLANRTTGRLLDENDTHRFCGNVTFAVM